jgi:hypothetical protein
LWVSRGTFGFHKCGDILDKLQSSLGSFSGRTLLHGVIITITIIIIIYLTITNILGVSGGIVNILGCGSMEYSE